MTDKFDVDKWFIWDEFFRKKTAALCQKDPDLGFVISRIQTVWVQIRKTRFQAATQ
jgi:hypothetical protein